MSGKTSELIALLDDGRRRSVPEIHEHLGPCRLNSRACEARKRLRKVGRDLVMTRAPGVAGAEAYSYQIVPLALEQPESSGSGSGCSSAAEAHHLPLPGSAPGLPDLLFSGSDEVLTTGAEQLSLLVAA